MPKEDAPKALKLTAQVSAVRTFRRKLSLFGSQFGLHTPLSRPFLGLRAIVLCQILGRWTKYSSKHLRLLPKLFH